MGLLVLTGLNCWGRAGLHQLDTFEQLGRWMATGAFVTYALSVS